MGFLSAALAHVIAAGPFYYNNNPEDVEDNDNDTNIEKVHF